MWESTGILEIRIIRLPRLHEFLNKRSYKPYKEQVKRHLTKTGSEIFKVMIKHNVGVQYLYF